MKANEVYQKELKECRRDLASIQWNSETLAQISDDIRCSNCQSQLVKPTNPEHSPPTIEFHCSSCGKYFLFEDIVAELLGNLYAEELYSAATEGGEPPIRHCHECSFDTFVVSEGLCVRCEAELYYISCDLCDEKLGPDDQEYDGLCGYHHYLANKND